MVKRAEIARYVVVAAILVFSTIAAAWPLFVAEDSVHHFDAPSEAAPFTASYSFLLVLLVFADGLGLVWLVRRIRGRS